MVQESGLGIWLTHGTGANLPETAVLSEPHSHRGDSTALQGYAEDFLSMSVHPYYA